MRPFKAIFIVLFLIAFQPNAHSQIKTGEVHLNDSTYNYYLDLFNDSRVFNWGVIPKNIRLKNYSIHLLNNSLDTLVAYSRTGGDPRILYYQKTREPIYPYQYLVLQPEHNMHISDRRGSFSSSTITSIKTRDTTTSAYLRTIWKYSNDTVLKKQKDIKENLNVVEKTRIAQNIKIHRNLADSLQKIHEYKEYAPINTRLSEVPKNVLDKIHLYVFAGNNNVSESCEVFLRRHNDLIPVKTKIEKGKYPYKLLLNPDKIEVADLVIKDKYGREHQIKVNLFPNRDVKVNYSGNQTSYKYVDSALVYIPIIKIPTDNIRVAIMEANINICDSSVVQVLENGQWISLIKNDTTSRLAYFEYTTKRKDFKRKIRWRKKSNTVWNTDWLYLQRAKDQAFENLTDAYWIAFNLHGKYIPRLNPGQYRVDILDDNFSYHNRSELKDSIEAVFKWYGIAYEKIGWRYLTISNDEDRFKINRALNKHFEKAQLSPAYVERGREEYFYKDVTVKFRLGTTKAQIEAIFRSVGINDFYIREDRFYDKNAIMTSFTLDDLLSPSTYAKLNKLYTQNEVLSVQFSLISEPQPD